MSNHLPITVTARDHRRLMHLAESNVQQGHPLAAHLLHELRRATLCSPDELPDDVVVLDTFVTYRIAGEDEAG